ncbi:hypothetical protein G9U51_07605 [Calidifontibacter sp. DB0510]|uniref:Uncharacterized protein n=1 Tax=Metallococcus carri TaxID=1656884 RepID=A0A967B1M7_9MICO|nr:hypothetical protein [Metallococcus carri]NHN55645.1 hypothetical protein [Metallococcus carri]NOP38171.1 hypothetical protein [Calidifontibacter sp. DB2511S]
MPTTLLFLLIVAIWAAYLVQHWIRRRDALATARSVDRFSESMRVLSRRDPLPQGVAPMASTGPARPGAPQVSVKAQRTSLRAGQPVVGEPMSNETEPVKTSSGFKLAAKLVGGPKAGPASSRGSSGGSKPGAKVGSTGGSKPGAKVASAGGSKLGAKVGSAGGSSAAAARARSAASSSAAATRGIASTVGSVARTAGHRFAQLSDRQVRGLSLLVSLAFLLVSLVFVAVGGPWWLLVAAVLEVAGVVAWLRRSALAEASVNPRETSVNPRETSRKSREASVVRRETSANPRETSVVRRETSLATAEQAQRPRAERPRAERAERPRERATVHAEPRRVVRTEQVAAAPSDVVFDNQPAPVQPVAAEVQQVEEAPPSASASVDGWQPVAVPPPTYTLKAKAPDREFEPAAVTPAYADTPVEDLPFDGLALDEELEELPSVYRAG